MIIITLHFPEFLLDFLASTITSDELALELEMVSGRRCSIVHFQGLKASLLAKVT
jgi:hypothetical protein